MVLVSRFFLSFFADSELPRNFRKDSVGYAAVYSLTTVVVPSFGQRRLGLRSNIVLMLLFGSGSVGSYVAGLLRTYSGSYLHAFVLSSFAWFAAIVSSCGFALSKTR